MTSPPIRPADTARGIDDWLNAVPLPIPLPPGDPSDWTCLFQLIGPRASFARDGREHVIPDEALRGLLEAAGRPVLPNESRALLLVTPLAGAEGGDSTGLPSLVRRSAATTPDVLRILEFHPKLCLELRTWLLQLAETDAGAHLRGAAIDALGAGSWPREGSHWRQVVATLGQWDGELDARRLLAMVRLGALPEELPMGELAPLHGWIPGCEAEAGHALLARYPSLSESLTQVVCATLTVVPGAAADVAEALPSLVARIPDERDWLAVFAEAGESVVEPLLALLRDPRSGDGAAPDGWKARMGAVMALGVIPEVGEPGLAILRAATMDDDADVRREATLALRAHGQDVPFESWGDSYGFPQRVGPHHPWGAAFVGGPVPLDIVSLLVRRDGEAMLAEVALALAFAHPDVAAPLLDALACDRGFDVPLTARIGAAAGLFATGTVPSVPALHALLLGAVGTGLDAGGGAAIGRAVHRSGESTAEERYPDLAESLAALASRDGDWQVRFHAVDVLDRLGEAGRFDVLLAILESGDPDADVRAIARRSRTPRFRTDTVPHLLGELVGARRHDTTARIRALERLLDRDAALAEPLASSLYRMEDRELAILSGHVLGGLTTSESALQRLSTGTQDLRHPSWIRREAACALLGALDPWLFDAGLVEELLETLDALSTTDSDADVQRMARRAADALSRRRP